MFAKRLFGSDLKTLTANANGCVAKTLSQMKVNESAVVSHLDVSCSQRLQMLMALGVMPGERVTIRQTFPSILLEAGFTQLAIDHDIAQSVIVS